MQTAQRYFLEACDEGQSVQIHGHVKGYHYVRLDAHTVFGVAEMSNHSLDQLDKGHPTITLLPSLASAKDVHQHLKDKGREKHSAALRLHGAGDKVSMHDVAELLATKFQHPYFKPHF